jgi:hypothetical protein
MQNDGGQRPKPEDEDGLRIDLGQRQKVEEESGAARIDLGQQPELEEGSGAVQIDLCHRPKREEEKDDEKDGLMMVVVNDLGTIVRLRAWIVR